VNQSNRNLFLAEGYFGLRQQQQPWQRQQPCCQRQTLAHNKVIKPQPPNQLLRRLERRRKRKRRNLRPGLPPLQRAVRRHHQNRSSIRQAALSLVISRHESLGAIHARLFGLTPTLKSNQLPVMKSPSQIGRATTLPAGTDGTLFLPCVLLRGVEFV
jgi:hypothetical protein